MTKNFSIREFECKSGAPTPPEVRANLQKVAENLQVLRDELKAPITINSGYRSPAHNKAIGGAKNSKHILGIAADIKVQGFAPTAVAAVIERLISEGKMEQGGLKAYPTFVHYDCRKVKARW